jgi:hypothetical protein
MFSLFLAREQRYLCLLKTGEARKILSSYITGELNLVAQPVGNGRDESNVTVTRVAVTSGNEFSDYVTIFLSKTVTGNKREE